MLEIVEILGPSSQGKTKPYLCRGDDDRLYYVKGANAGPKAQACEWLVGHLAQKFGLPVPPFQLANISPELLAETAIEWRALGAGIAFASEKQERAHWFEPGFAKKVEKKLKQDVLAFDWWVRNLDRLEDNPNLLWDAASKRMFVIDHAFSFDDNFWPTTFQSYHVFSGECKAVFGDLACQAEYAQRFSNALAAWDQACAKINPEWTSLTCAEGLDVCAAYNALNRCLTNELWRMV